MHMDLILALRRRRRPSLFRVCKQQSLGSRQQSSGGAREQKGGRIVDRGPDDDGRLLATSSDASQQTS